MTRLAIGILAVATGAVFGAQDRPQAPKPVKEHEWLRQLVGEWDVERRPEAGSGETAKSSGGTESGRMIGGFWAVFENREKSADGFTAILTLGYDPGKKEFVGTWIDSTGSDLWRYKGSLDDSGRSLTLLTEDPSNTRPGAAAKYKEVIEIKSKDHKVFTSYVEKDGKWERWATSTYRRKN